MSSTLTPAPPRVTAVIVSHNTRDDLRRCLRSLQAHAGLPCEVVVVDNASADGSADMVGAEFPETRLFRNRENVGFSRANNQGLSAAAAAYVLILNSDAELTSGALPALAALLDARPRVGAVGPRTLNPDGTLQVSFGPALTPLAEWRTRRLVRGVKRRDPAALAEAEVRAAVEREPDWVSGSCLLARKDALAAVGGFDEAFFLYEEDVDLCLRLRRAGWGVVFTPAASVVHHLGRSTEADPARARLEYHRSHLRYYRKHNGALLSAALRAFIGVGATVGWLAALGPGLERRERRRQQARVLGAAFSNS